MKYIIEILQTRLEDEIKAKAIAEEITAGNGFKFKSSTMEAFIKSKSLAEERIPQLEKAISILKELEGK